jgi:hypothetical protein
MGRPLIISASRRTDLPGFHAAECDRRIRDRLRRLRSRQLYGVVSWTRHFDKAGVPRWTDDGKQIFLTKIAGIAAGLGLLLLSCCQPENLAFAAGIEQASCIPRDVLERGHPLHTKLDLPLDPSQRTNCLCVESEDIGRYDTDRCRGGCAYCYSKAGGPFPS